MVAAGAATRSGATVFAKSSDRPPGECQPLTLVPRALHPAGTSVRCQYVAIAQARETALVLGSRPVWLWGFEHGVNEHGVAIGNETIFAREAPAGTGLIGMDLVRLALERADSAERAVELLTALVEEHGQGGSCFRDMDWPYNSSFLVADAAGAWIVEAAGRHWAARRCAAVDSISNQVSIGRDWERLSQSAIEHARSQGWPVAEPFDFAATYRDLDGVPRVFSEGRLRRSRELLAAGGGRLGVAELREMLRDHHGRGRCFSPGPGPEDEAFYTLCMHQGPSRTVASMVVELEAGGPLVAWCSMGRPCAAVFFPVIVGAPLPDALAQGSDEPGPALWWVFERLAERAEASVEVAERIRSTFDVLEASLDAELERSRAALRRGAGAARLAETLSAQAAARVDRAARELLAAVGG